MLIKMKRKVKKAQTVAEYAILLGVVISAIAGMQVYLKRGLQARVKSGTDAITSPSAEFTAGGYTTNFKSISQYEPYYKVSKGESYQESVKQKHHGEGKIVEEIVSEVSASAAGSYLGEEAGKDIQETRDRIWESAGEDE